MERFFFNRNTSLSVFIVFPIGIQCFMSNVLKMVCQLAIASKIETMTALFIIAIAVFIYMIYVLIKPANF